MVHCVASLALILGFAYWFSGRATALLWVLLLNSAAVVSHPVLAALFGTEAVHRVLMPPTGFGGWLFQAAWVPQHIASVSAVVIALFFLGRLAVDAACCCSSTLVLLAVAGFESSTWIGGVLFPAAAAMAGALLLIDAASRQRLRFLVCCAVAAILALCLALPMLHDQFLATDCALTGHRRVPPLRGSRNRDARSVTPHPGLAGLLARPLADRISRRLRDRRRFLMDYLRRGEAGGAIDDGEAASVQSFRAARGMSVLFAPGCSRA